MLDSTRRTLNPLPTARSSRYELPAGLYGSPSKARILRPLKEARHSATSRLSLANECGHAGAVGSAPAKDDEEKRNAAIGRSRFARRPEAIWASGRVREGADAVAVPGDEGEFAKAGMLSREGRAGSCKGWPESCPVIVGAKGGSVLPLISTLSGVAPSV